MLGHAQTRLGLTEKLQIPASAIKVICPAMGGGFGSKLELSKPIPLFGIPKAFLLKLLVGFDAINDKWKGGFTLGFDKRLSDNLVAGQDVLDDVELRRETFRRQCLDFRR